MPSTLRSRRHRTLLSIAIALVLLLAPAVHHRLRFREGDKEYLLRKPNREAIAGSAAIALAVSGALYVVTISSSAPSPLSSSQQR